MDDETEGKTLVQGYTAHWWQVREGKPSNFGDRVTGQGGEGKGRRCSLRPCGQRETMDLFYYWDTDVSSGIGGNC